MANLILRTQTSPYGDTTKGSVLAASEVDNNFINLKAADIVTGSTSGAMLQLKRNDGTQVNIDLSGFSGSTSGGTTTIINNNNYYSGGTGGALMGNLFS